MWKTLLIALIWAAVTAEPFLPGLARGPDRVNCCDKDMDCCHRGYKCCRDRSAKKCCARGDGCCKHTSACCK